MQKLWVVDATKSISRIDLVRLPAKYETENLAYVYSEKTSSTWDDVAKAAADESSVDDALVVVEINLDVCLVCQISPTFHGSSHRTTKVVTGRLIVKLISIISPHLLRD